MDELLFRSASRVAYPRPVGPRGQTDCTQRCKISSVSFKYTCNLQFLQACCHLWYLLEYLAWLQLADKAGVSEAGLDPLYKVLRVMAQYDMLDEQPGKLFSSNVATSLLVRGKKPSLGHMAAHQINIPKLEAWKVLPEAVKTGQTAFMLAHNGETMYQVWPVDPSMCCAFQFCFHHPWQPLVLELMEVTECSSNVDCKFPSATMDCSL